MPIYAYACEKCGKVSDFFQKIEDPEPEKCESCGAAGPLVRCLSRTSFVLKGGGWYSDLYSSSKKEGASKEGATKEGAAKEKDAGGKDKASTPATTATPAAPSTGSAGSTAASGGSSDNK